MSDRSDSTDLKCNRELLDKDGALKAIAVARAVERERCALLAVQLATNCPNSRAVLLILADLIRSGEDAE